MKRAIHRLNAELLFLELHRREHRIGIVLFMSADEPEIALGDVRRENDAVSALHKLFAKIVLHLFANGAAFGMPEDEPLPVLFLNRKQIEFTSQAPMVAL